MYHRSFFCLVKKRNETFYNGKKCNDKDLIWHEMGGEMAKKLHNPPSPFLLGKNRSSENPVREKWVISFCLGRAGGNDKNMGERFSCGYE